MTLGAFRPRSAVAGLAVAAALAAPALTAPALAHPHVWVDVETGLHFDAQGRLTAVESRWTFDEFYTAFAVQGLDTDNSGSFEPAELQELADVNMAALADWSYFTTVNPGIAPPTEADRRVTGVAFAAPEDARNRMVDGRLQLAFTLPLAEPLAPPFTVATFDPTFYVAMLLVEEGPVTVVGAPPPGCRVDPVLAEEQDVYFTDDALPSQAALALRARQLADEVQVACEVRR